MVQVKNKRDGSYIDKDNYVFKLVCLGNHTHIFEKLHSTAK